MRKIPTMNQYKNMFYFFAILKGNDSIHTIDYIEEIWDRFIGFPREELKVEFDDISDEVLEYSQRYSRIFGTDPNEIPTLLHSYDLLKMVDLYGSFRNNNFIDFDKCHMELVTNGVHEIVKKSVDDLISEQEDRGVYYVLVIKAMERELNIDNILNN